MAGMEALQSIKNAVWMISALMFLYEMITAAAAIHI